VTFAFILLLLLNVLVARDLISCQCCVKGNRSILVEPARHTVADLGGVEFILRVSPLCSFNYGEGRCGYHIARHEASPKIPFIGTLGLLDRVPLLRGKYVCAEFVES
jgi:hypothetical protein